MSETAGSNQTANYMRRRRIMNQKKLASKAAMICYGFGDLASQFVWTFVGSYLTVFYTDIVGIVPAAVSAIMLIARIWDAINDPMMGAIAERTRSKLRTLPSLYRFRMSVFGNLFSTDITNPFDGKSTAGVLWAGIIYIIAGMLYTLVNIPYGALAGVMTEDADQRNKINTSRNIGMNLGMVIVNALSAVLMLRFFRTGCRGGRRTGLCDNRTDLCYRIHSVFLIVVKTAKENVKPVGKPQKFSLKETLGNLVKINIL